MKSSLQKSSKLAYLSLHISFIWISARYMLPKSRSRLIKSSFLDTYSGMWKTVRWRRKPKCKFFSKARNIRNHISSIMKKWEKIKWNSYHREQKTRSKLDTLKNLRRRAKNIATHANSAVSVVEAFIHIFPHLITCSSYVPTTTTRKKKNAFIKTLYIHRDEAVVFIF